MYRSNSGSQRNSQSRMLNNKIRVMNAVPGAPGADIYVNDTLAVRDLSFGEYTTYLPLPDGMYTVEVYVTGTKDTPALREQVNLSGGSVVTAVIAGKPDNAGIYLFSDVDKRINAGKAGLRFANLSPDAPAVDIALPDGTVLFEDISFGEISPYIAAPAGTYSLDVKTAANGEVIFSVTDVELEPGKYYTIYAAGLVGGEPGLEILLLEDGAR